MLKKRYAKGEITKEQFESMKKIWRREALRRSEVRGADGTEMSQNVNQKLIVRLLLAWIVLSILIGAAVFFLEARKIDAYVVTLATEESRGFIKEDRDDLNSPDPARRERLYRESRKHIEAGHFIAVKLYNRDKAMIVEADHPAVRLIEREIAPHRREMDLTDAVHFRKFYGEGFQIYVLIVTPFKTADHQTAGYFEGVYRVPPQTMAEIKNRILLSLLQVVVIIFFTTHLPDRPDAESGADPADTGTLPRQYRDAEGPGQRHRQTGQRYKPSQLPRHDLRRPPGGGGRPEAGIHHRTHQGILSP